MRSGAAGDLLGKKLMEGAVVTSEQLADALEQQKRKKGEKLGQVLVRLGYCSEDAVARVIAERAGVPFVSLETYPVDATAMALVSPEVAKRYRALPIGFSDGKLVVAMEYPNNIQTMDDLRMLTGFDIKPVVVPDSELAAAIERYSRASVGVEPGVGEEQAAEEITAEPEEGEETPAVQLANVIMTQAAGSRASDVHIEPYEGYLRVRFRIDGVLHDVMRLPRRMHASLVSRFKVMANMDIAERRIPQDGRMTLKIEARVIDIRVASLPGSFGERLTLRLLDRSARLITLEELGVAPVVLRKYREAIKLPYGMILVTGPTGSGKTTTLYASLAAVDRVGKNVITIEDPVEYRMEGINQIQINPKAGLTFAAGLRSILRSDPDIIMVGEIRDAETARIAVESALTGHLVFSTVHTNDAAAAISRLTEMGIEPFLTVSSLSCVLAQRLVRVLCPHCRQPYEMPRSDAENIPDFPLESGEEVVRLYRPAPHGCMRCSNTGYRGRIGVFEFLPVGETIQRLTLERRSAREIKEAAVAEGMITLRQDGLMKVKQGLTSLEEVMRVVL